MIEQYKSNNNLGNNGQWNLYHCKSISFYSFS